VLAVCVVAYFSVTPSNGLSEALASADSCSVEASLLSAGSSAFTSSSAFAGASVFSVVCAVLLSVSFAAPQPARDIACQL
jgi:S-adenosylmethionine hydrolase